ncbi:MAG: glycosyltransferase [Bacteroidota bacterium]
MKHICHITVLNPLKHTRIYYKWALSQQEMGHQVTVMAQGDHGVFTDDHGVQLIGTGLFHRLSRRRLLFAWQIRRAAREQRADLYVLHSPELLPLGKWLKNSLNTQVVYDVHEDYKANILAAAHYPQWMRRPLAQAVRRFECKATFWLDAVSYAEKCYDNVLNVPPEKKFLLRNTFSFRPVQNQNPSIELPNVPYMLFTGTIAHPWGIMETLQVWKKINAQQSLHLVVAGFAPQKEILDQIASLVASWGLGDRFTLIGGNAYVPYVDILHAIRHCAFGTALYHSQPNILGKVPTKVYEFMALKRPLLYSDALLPILDQVGEMGLYFQDQEGDEVWEFFEAWQEPSYASDTYMWTADEGELRKMHQQLGLEAG